MGKNEETKNANTPAQGAEGAVGASEENNSEGKKVMVLPESAPDWLKDLIASGAAVIVSIEDLKELSKSNEAVIASNDELIASNQKVVDSIEVFKEKGGDMIKAIVNSAKGITVDETSFSIPQPKIVEVNPDAKYVVKAGSKFQDSRDPKNMFVEGQDVTDLGEERLAKLLSHGLIEEVVQTGDND